MSRTVWALLAVFVCLQGAVADAYKGPVNLCATQDGKTIYVVNKDSHEIAVLNTVEDKIVKTIFLENEFFPQGAALSADEKTLYITGGGSHGRVFALDPATGTITKTARAGHTPTAAVLSPDGTKLFVCNQFTNDVSEYQLPDLTPIRTIKVVREPSAAVVTKDGKYLLVANSLPLMPNNFINDPNTGFYASVSNVYVAAEISVIDIASGKTRSINNLPNGSGILLGMCLSPDGRYVYVTTVIARFLVRTTHVTGGWINTAGILVLDTAQLDQENGGFIHAVLIDDLASGAANPWGITTSADGKTIYVAVAGTSEVIAVDAVEMHKKIEANPWVEIPRPHTNTYQIGLFGKNAAESLFFLDGLKKRSSIPGKGARALTVAGNNIYVGMYFSDTIQKLDTAQLHPTEIALGPVPNWTPERRGEVWWNDATLCQAHWQSCASCHPDARTDGHNWDLLNDGQDNPKNTKSLLLSHQTPPSMWQGIRDNFAVDGWDTETMGLQCIRTGFKAIHFTIPDEEKCKDIDAYLRAEKPVPSPYLANGKLSEKAQRGKQIFEDSKVGCVRCHPAPLFTDKKLHNVNTRTYYDTVDSFDTPTLVEVWRTAPYLHDGRYVEMKEVFTHGKHGNVGGLTDAQIDDMVEYILSL